MPHTHHAYYIEGPTNQYDEYRARIKPHLAERYERLGVDEVRRLIERSALKHAANQVVLLVAPFVTTEAQQALLKLFEEPQPGTTFVLVVPHGVLLPTLRSRMLPYPGWESLVEPAADAKKFLRSSGKERSDLIAALLKDDEGAKERSRSLVDALEQELYKKKSDPAARAALADLAMVRDYLRDRAPSLKMLLEHLAIALPTSKP